VVVVLPLLAFNEVVGADLGRDLSSLPSSGDFAPRRYTTRA
jgi:hypothetical protein